jgi:type VI secretion system protein ImpL
MKFNRGMWIAIALLVVWLVLGWFLGTWMGMKAPAIWYVRGGWWLLGIAGFVGYVVLRPKDDSAPLEGAAASAAQEIDYNFGEASKRIQAATGNKQLNSLPAIFLLGDLGAAKTTVLTQSGIEPELIAGQAMQDTAVAPTRSVNLWYARNTLFIDPAGGVVADPGARRKLFKKFLPVQLNSLLASKAGPTRSVLLTVDCDTLIQPGGANALAAKARDYQTILSELSRELGSSFPVYVLFTKADKIPYFRDFVENLSEAEAAEVLGVSLPIAPSGVQGAYAERQTLRLNNAFQTIYYSLADKRPVYLAREHVAANLSNIYEFPREFAKLKPLLVQFLTDLCRPNQLGTSPFLRGFYFSGVRPVTISDVVSASELPVVEDAGFDAGATRMFNRPTRSAPIAETRQAGSRRVPQWIFLRSLFAGVLLADRVGSTAAQVNVKVNFVRRLLLATAAAAALAMALWWTVSYRNNQALVHDALEAARSVPSQGLPAGQLASTDALQRLSKVRETLAVLNGYERNGAPWSYGALLYKGNDIREPLRTTYYALFRRLLLQPAQQTLVEITSKPDAFQPQGYAGYQSVYNALKAYLITTNNHDKQWSDLVPVLVQHWKKDQTVDSERESQATANFAFYAEELPEANPYPQYSVPDKDAVTNARIFLNKFPLEDGIYRAMLDAAGDKLRPIIFNRDYPGTEDTVRNNYRVEPWFLKQGYINFQKQVQNPNASLTREEWVLGPSTQQNIDKAAIMANLKVRYDKDFIKTWREFLAATSESVPYSDYVRAASVLERLGGPQSPLMQLFCVASENTSVPVKEVSDAFQPVQIVAPPGCLRQLISPAAKPYVEGLGNLSNALKAIGPVTAPNQSAAQSAAGSVSNALTAETGLVTGFPSDPTDPKATVLSKSQSLLKEPIEQVSPTLGGLNNVVVNGQAGGMCATINPVFRKYPFNSNSKEDATLQEVNEALNPQSGKLWAFVKGTLATFVQQAGSDYVAIPGQPSTVTPGFLGFLNRASHMSQAIYHGDPSGNANMSFTIQALPSQDVDHVSLAIDGITLAGDPKNKPSQTFPWPGSAQQFTLQARFGGSSSDFTIVSTTGLWAVWHALERADRGTGDSLQWTPITPGEGPIKVNGHPLTVKFGLDPQSAQVLRAQYFAGLSCPGKAIQ